MSHHTEDASSPGGPDDDDVAGRFCDFAVTPGAGMAVDAIENLISQDDGGRGMASLVVPGDLLRAAATLARLPLRRRRKSCHAVVLSGFPCRVDDDPPTETDGPPGAFAVARAALSLGYDSVAVVTDSCNGDVFGAARRGLDLGPPSEVDDGDGGGGGDGRLTVEVFPPEGGMTPRDEERMAELVEDRCDVIVACERAGPAKDGRCYTMRGIDMTGRNLIAPLHRIVDLAREGGSRDGGGGTAVVPPFLAIGDGGNELGMGKVYDAVVSNPMIPNGEKIASMACPADHLIAASVSNWGGYALAAAAAVVRCDDVLTGRLAEKKAQPKSIHDEGRQSSESKPVIDHWTDRCLPTEEGEIALLRRCVDAGCRDGVSGRVEATVDGMPLESSMACLRHICAEARKARVGQ